MSFLSLDTVILAKEFDWSQWENILPKLNISLQAEKILPIGSIQKYQNKCVTLDSKLMGVSFIVL